MLQADIVIEVERRHETGKNAANRLRTADRIPAVIYGGGKEMETLPLSVARKDMLQLFRKGLHENTIFQLHLKGTDQQRHVMIRDLSVHPVSRDMLHVDFVRVLMDRKLRVKTPIEPVGASIGVKSGGLLEIVTHSVEIECLPADMPHAIQVDVTNLDVHATFRVLDLKVPEKIRVLEPKDRVLVHVTLPRAEEAPAAATTEVAPVAATEPEVIKKGKKEEEGAAAEKAPAAKPEKKEKK